MARSTGAAQLPEGARRFVLTCIPSVPHLEALLLFHRNAPQAQHIPDVATALYLSLARATDVVEHLIDHGVLIGVGGGAARYRPNDEELASTIQCVVVAYHEDLIGLTHLIHDAVQRNATRFADAFRLRKDP